MHAIEAYPGLEWCGEAETEAEAWAATMDRQPDALIVDLTLKSGSGLELIKRIRSHKLATWIVVSSMYEPEEYANRCLEAGANAHLHKTAPIDELLGEVVAVARQEMPVAATLPLVPQPIGVATLTDRELEVFRMIGEGYSTRAIAKSLCRSIKTIESYRAKIKKKLGAPTSELLARDAACWVFQQAS